MEKIPDNIQEEDSNEKPSKLGGIIKKTLTAAGVAGITLGAMELKDSAKEQEKWMQENPRESVEKVCGDVLDISSIKSHEDMHNMPEDIKFYFHSNIHNEDGVKWVRLLASPYTNINAVTANPAIINFIEQNPEEDNAFLRKSESGQLELVRENGEVVETF